MEEMTILEMWLKITKEECKLKKSAYFMLLSKLKLTEVKETEKIKKLISNMETLQKHIEQHKQTIEEIKKRIESEGLKNDEDKI